MVEAGAAFEQLAVKRFQPSDERLEVELRAPALACSRAHRATTLSVIPMGVAFLMFYTNRDYVEFFVKDPSGNQMAGVAIGFQVLGYLIMKKIVNIEV